MSFLSKHVKKDFLNKKKSCIFYIGRGSDRPPPPWRKVPLRMPVFFYNVLPQDSHKVEFQESADSGVIKGFRPQRYSAKSRFIDILVLQSFYFTFTLKYQVNEWLKIHENLQYQRVVIYVFSVQDKKVKLPPAGADVMKQ